MTGNKRYVAIPQKEKPNTPPSMRLTVCEHVFGVRNEGLHGARHNIHLTKQRSRALLLQITPKQATGQPPSQSDYAREMRVWVENTPRATTMHASAAHLTGPESRDAGGDICGIGAANVHVRGEDRGSLLSGVEAAFQSHIGVLQCRVVAGVLR